MKQATSDLIVHLHRDNSVGLIARRLARPARAGVGRQRGLEVLGEPEIIDHQLARLVLEHPVDPRDRLHQSVAAHRLVSILTLPLPDVSLG